MKAANSNGYILVTGASSGIGKAIAFELARRGYNLLLTALPETGLPRVKDELSRYAVTVHYYEVNLIFSGDCRRLFNWCRENKFPVFGLVNNAGVGTLGSFETSSIDSAFEMISLNIRAVTYLTWMFIPALKQSRTSYILNVSSVASDISIPNKAVYAATKAFVKRFSHCLREELGDDGVRVSCLCPGGTFTSARVNAIMSRCGWNVRLFCKTADFVARAAVDGLLEGRATIVPGTINKVILVARHLIPAVIQSRILKAIFSAQSRRAAMPSVGA